MKLRGNQFLEMNFKSIKAKQVEFLRLLILQDYKYFFGNYLLPRERCWLINPSSMRKAALKRANSVCQCTCQAGKKIPLSSALTKLIEVGLNFSEVLPIFLVKLSTLTNCVFEKFLLDKKLPWKIFQRSIGSAKAIFAGADAAEERSRRPHGIS